MSPSTAGATSNFKVGLMAFDGTATTNQKIEWDETFSVTILSPTYPHDFWFNWPTEDLYDREVRAGDIAANSIGELYIRMSNRHDLPLDGKLKVTLPDDFDIAQDGILRCEIGFTDMPFDNMPLYWTKDRMHVLSPHCTWDAGEIDIDMPEVSILREYYGITANACTFLTITTTGAVDDNGDPGTNGIQAPENPGWYTVRITSYNPQLEPIESYYSQIYIDPIDIPASANLAVTMSGVGASEDSVVTVSFTTKIDIPRSAAHTIDNIAQSPGRLQVSFKAHDGFLANLGTTYSTGDEYPCQAISGITGTNASSDITCTITLGADLVHDGPTSTTTTHPADAFLTISDFEDIAAETSIVIHIPKVKNPATNAAIPEIGVGVYSTSPDIDALVTWLYKTTWVQTSAIETAVYNAVTDEHGLSNAQITSSSIIIDAVSDWEFTLLNFGGVVSGDYIIVQLPTAWTNMARNPDTSVEVGGTALPHNIYPDERMIAIKSDATIGAGTTTLKLNNFRNPPSNQTSCNCLIQIYAYSGGASSKLADTWTSASSVFADGVVDADGFTLPGYTSSGLSTSNDHAEAVDVTITYTFNNIAEFPAGTVLKFKLPGLYPHPSQSSPSPTCAISLANASCTNDDISYDFTLTDAVSPNTAITITLTGVKNPTVVSQWPVAPNGFRLEAYTSNNEPISYMDLTPGFDVETPEDIGAIHFNFETRFSSATTITDYTIRFWQAKTMQVDTTIIISFPQGYILNADDGCEILDQYIDVQSCSVYLREATIVMNQVLHPSTPINVRFPNVQAPVITSAEADGSQIFTPFNIKSQYDGTTQCESDDSLTSSQLRVTAAPLPMQFHYNNFYPQNESEFATYNFTLVTNAEVDANYDASMIFVFPDQFAEDLIEVGKTMACSSYPHATSCFAQEPREIHFKQFKQALQAQSEISFQIFGITNPARGFTDVIKVFLRDNNNGEVIAMNAASDEFFIADPPKALNMTYVYADNYAVNSKADYQWAFKTIEEPVKANGEILIDWPSEYYGQFFFDEYKCSLESTEVTGDITCPLVFGKQRTSISGFSAIPAPSEEVTIKMQQVPTPTYPGESGAWIISTYDTDTQLVLERSYSETTTIKTINFSSEDFSIYHEYNLIVEVVKYTYSNPFEISLRIPAYETLQLQAIGNVEGLLISPSQIDFLYNWDTTKELRVGAPHIVELGKYVVEFQKGGGSDNNMDELYSAVKDVYVNVVSPDKQYQATMDEIPELYVGDTSIEIWFTLSNPVADVLSFQLSLEDLEQEASGAITFSPSVVTFGDGDIRKSFTMTVNSWVERPHVKVIPGGAAYPAYKFD